MLQAIIWTNDVNIRWRTAENKSIFPLYLFEYVYEVTQFENIFIHEKLYLHRKCNIDQFKKIY